ncbi:MAG: DUF1501 domain-containing protein, partial [Armatimonadaceae bacterium]
MIVSRRDWLLRSAAGFGGVALASLLADEARADGVLAKPHHAPKAKAVIFLYMDGGPSQVDTFDYKPALEKFNGQDPHKVLTKVEPTQFANVGKVMASPWKFKQHGQSGAWVSELFPHVAGCVDDLAIVKSLTSKFSEHTSANYFLHTGAGIQGRPSWGAWASYGLGTGNKDLPTFVILNGGLVPPGGLDNFNSGFLPAAHQGSVLKAGKNPLAYVLPLEKEPARQSAKLDLMRKLDSLGSAKGDAIDSAIANYETAYRMQTVVPELADLSKESDATKKLYGLDSKYPHTVTFGTQCLLARRLVQKGVRFIEVNLGGWDTHR